MNKREHSLNVARIKPLSDLAILPALRIPVRTLRPAAEATVTSCRICICCGEPMAEGNSMSRDPNVCASCSSLSDGMDHERTQPVGNGDYGWQNAGISVPIHHQPQTLGESHEILP